MVSLADNHKEVRGFDVEYGLVLDLILVSHHTLGFPHPFSQRLHESYLPKRNRVFRVHQDTVSHLQR